MSSGSGVSSLLHFVLGAQISGAGTAPRFLPPFWEGLGQILPAGAGSAQHPRGERRHRMSRHIP